MKNVIVSKNRMAYLMNLALAHAIFFKDARIVFNGEDFEVETGDKLSLADENNLIVGGVFKHKYFSKLKIPTGEKISKEYPEMTDFQVWLANRNFHYFNKIYDAFYWKGINIVHKDDQNMMLENEEIIEVINEFAG
jgi:hypothetical protein